MKNLLLFKILGKRSKYLYAILALLSIMSSAAHFILLLLINHAITGTALPFFAEHAWLVYSLILLLSLLITKYFQAYIIRLTNDLLLDFEMDILEQLRTADYEAFEKLGANRLYTAIGDTRTLGTIPETFINALNALIIIACCLINMTMTSIIGGASVLCVMALLLSVYLIRNKNIEKDLNLLRNLGNEYYRYLNDLLLGFKEVKMGIERNENIYKKFLRINRSDSRNLTVKTSMKYLSNELTGSYSWYVLLGIVMFAFPTVIHINPMQISAFVVTILYMMGPVAMIISVIPFYTNIKIALERLTQFEVLMKSSVNAGESATAGPMSNPFESLVFDDVVYEYFDQKQSKIFTLGPINLTVTKGEVIFITGGNGSGKSTFINLLTGLYKPTTGNIILNNEALSPGKYRYYSNRMSVIFTNNYLFSENYDGFDIRATNAQLIEYIELLHLGKVMRFNESKSFLDNKLSKGQQKRLALVYALMEQREVLILDEWAAEQDPYFRSYFYKIIIPRLKQMGKTIVAVTHDDEYYYCADRLIKFDYGKIVSDSTGHVSELAAAQGPQALQ